MGLLALIEIQTSSAEKNKFILAHFQSALWSLSHDENSTVRLFALGLLNSQADAHPEMIAKFKSAILREFHINNPEDYLFEMLSKLKKTPAKKAITAAERKFMLFSKRTKESNACLLGEKMYLRRLNSIFN